MVFWLHGCSCNVLQIWFRARRGAGLCPGDALGRWNLSFRPQLHQPGAVSGWKYLQLKIYFVCQERLLSEHVMSFWVNFAKTGKKKTFWSTTSIFPPDLNPQATLVLDLQQPDGPLPPQCSGLPMMPDRGNIWSFSITDLIIFLLMHQSSSKLQDIQLHPTTTRCLTWNLGLTPITGDTSSQCGTIWWPRKNIHNHNHASLPGARITRKQPTSPASASLSTISPFHHNQCSRAQVRERHDHQGVVGVGHRGGDDGDGELYMNEYQQVWAQFKIFSKGNITFTPGPHVLFPSEGFAMDRLSIIVVAIGVIILAINIFICGFIIRKNKKVNLAIIQCLKKILSSRCKRGKISWRGR